MIPWFGELRLLVEAGRSPHTYSSTQSDVWALERADCVVWFEPVMEPLLERPVRKIVQDGAAFPLMHLDGLTVLRTWKGGIWAGHAHAHGETNDAHGDHDDASAEADGAHDKEESTGQSEAHSNAVHGHEQDQAGSHNPEHEGDAHERGSSSDLHTVQGVPEGEVDPHVWLDPDNARVIVRVLAQWLAALDPQNAETYRQNVEATAQRIKKIAETMAPIKSEPYVVFHDTYHDFESYYGTKSVGSITLTPDRTPGLIGWRKFVTRSRVSTPAASSASCNVPPTSSKRWGKTRTRGLAPWTRLASFSTVAVSSKRSGPVTS
jgi:zinc transport system substrate-binding protein